MIGVKSTARITARWGKEKPNYRKAINKATYKAMYKTSSHYVKLSAVYKDAMKNTVIKTQRVI